MQRACTQHPPIDNGTYSEIINHLRDQCKIFEQLCNEIIYFTNLKKSEIYVFISLNSKYLNQIL